VVLGIPVREVHNLFADGTLTLSGAPFQKASAKVWIDNFPRDLPVPPTEPHNPEDPTPAGLQILGLGSSPFDRHY
jgi:hypothetical protein